MKKRELSEQLQQNLLALTDGYGFKAWLDGYEDFEDKMCQIVEDTVSPMEPQAEKYYKYYEAMDLIGCKHVTTPRQYNNGTRVFRLPFKDAWGHDIDFAIYKSGYVRRLVKLGYCPCYQINKKKAESRMVEVKSGPHKGYFYKLRSSERVLIPGNGDRLEYLFNYIMRNYFKAKPKHNRTIDMKWLDFCAKWQYGAFGFNTCAEHIQNQILKSLQQ